MCLSLAGCVNNHAKDVVPTVVEADTVCIDSCGLFDTDMAVDAVEYVDTAACFVAEEISDSIFALIDGCSYHSNSPVKRKDLRLVRVLHYDAEGRLSVGEIICNKLIANDLIDIFRHLYRVRYPIERMRLVDYYGADDEASMADNNTSCYNCRTMTGAQRLSKHASGMAIDINPLYNPYVKKKNGTVVSISPDAGKVYADRSIRHAYAIIKGDECYRQFLSHGFRWGGDWRRSVKDYQHFEK